MHWFCGSVQQVPLYVNPYMAENAGELEGKLLLQLTNLSS